MLERFDEIIAKHLMILCSFEIQCSNQEATVEVGNY